ncbi:mitochondrial potassium channel ATP-binding subunit isoform X1 [Vespula maculifrons]|uniref:Mitochondrial potassium channel ATP-binding subunit isoform X1 n=1 Tax=Vespula maculifrons TaxID=7453 RepID=A0ABD2AGW7_VESMC
MKTFISFLVLYLNGKSINAMFIERFYDGDKSISIDKWDIRSLTSSYPKGTPLNFALHVVCYLMYQIVKPAEEAGSAPEFIVNLPSDRKPELVREALN